MYNVCKIKGRIGSMTIGLNEGVERGFHHDKLDFERKAKIYM